MHRVMLMTILALVILAAALTIFQIWAPLVNWAVYIKAMMTIGLIVTVLGLVMILKADLGEHKKLKDENYLD